VDPGTGDSENSFVLVYKDYVQSNLQRKMNLKTWEFSSSKSSLTVVEGVEETVRKWLFVVALWGTPTFQMVKNHISVLCIGASDEREKK
jgi:hypothetical protein